MSTSAPRIATVAVSLEKGYKRVKAVCWYPLGGFLRIKDAVMKTLLKRIWRQESGQDTTEYALLAAMIALVVLAAVYSFGKANANSMNSSAGSVATGSASAGGGGGSGSGGDAGGGSGGGTAGSGGSGQSGSGGSGGSGGSAVAAAVRVVAAGRVVAVDRFRPIRLILKVSSNPEAGANFNKSFLPLVA